MDFLEIIKTRRSIRKYEDKEIPKEDLNKILESVKWAPSWTNCQCWEIIQITDTKIKEAIKQNLEEYKNPAQKAVLQAPYVLALCAKKGVSGYYNNKASTKFGDWFMFDLGIACQNIALTAHSLGLSSVVIGLFDHDKINKILKVEEGFETVVLMPIGYPAKESKPPKRREISEFLHSETF